MVVVRVRLEVVIDVGVVVESDVLLTLTCRPMSSRYLLSLVWTIMVSILKVQPCARALMMLGQLPNHEVIQVLIHTDDEKAWEFRSIIHSGTIDWRQNHIRHGRGRSSTVLVH
jgi:hypothetical protein